MGKCVVSLKRPPIGLTIYHRALAKMPKREEILCKHKIKNLYMYQLYEHKVNQRSKTEDKLKPEMIASETGN